MEPLQWRMDDRIDLRVVFRGSPLLFSLVLFNTAFALASAAYLFWPIQPCTISSPNILPLRLAGVPVVLLLSFVAWILHRRKQNSLNEDRFVDIPWWDQEEEPAEAILDPSSVNFLAFGPIWVSLCAYCACILFFTAGIELRTSVLI